MAIPKTCSAGPETPWPAIFGEHPVLRRRIEADLGGTGIRLAHDEERRYKTVFRFVRI
jgi:hypothetical protein